MPPRRSLCARIGCLLLACVWLLACTDPSGTSPPTDTNTTTEGSATDLLTVHTLYGTVRGVADSLIPEVRVFRGLPYAAPPVGALRWRPPEAPAPWPGVREADRFGPACEQATNTSAFVWRRGTFEHSEDCLLLNIWARSDAHQHPVMVWFHGGAHTSGMGHARIFDGARLAGRGVVLVTLNYRLGPLGFLAHPWFAAESSHDSAGNYGLLDKVAALDWIRDNIAQFGGDPANVTVFGQSAGSQSVCTLMTSPLAQGLFHKAIGQSASCVAPLPDPDPPGRQRATALVAALAGVDTPTALRQAPSAQLLDAAERSGWAQGSRIVVDGWAVPEPPVAVYRDGRQARVPLLLGSLSGEGIHLIPQQSDLSLPDYLAFLDELGGPLAEEVQQAYAVEQSDSPGVAQHAIRTDLFMALGMRRWAAYQRRAGPDAYLYYMDHVPPAFHLYMPDAPELDLPGGPRSAGAYHSGDLAYVFGTTRNVGLGWTDEDHRLAEQMMHYSPQSARTGNPNGAGRPVWPVYDPATHTTLALNPAARAVQGVLRKKLAALAAIAPLD